MKSLILFVVFFSTLLLSNDGNEKVWKGINAFYNYEFNKSVRILNEARNEFPYHPSVHFTWAVSKWLYSRAYHGIDESYKVLSESLEIIIPTYKDLIDKFPNDKEIRLYYASTLGLKARVHLGKKEWINVIIEGLRGYSSIKSINNNHPEYFDALFPIGILNYFSGKMSGFTQFFAQIAGIQPDVSLGINQMKYSADEGDFAKIEASQTLAYIYLWMDQDFEKAEILSLKLRNEFPNSIYNQFMFTESLIFLNKLSEAKSNLELSYKILIELPKFTKLYWDPLLKYQEALIYFKEGELNKSLELVNSSISNYSAELDTQLGYAFLLRGNIYDLQNKRNLSLINYREVIKLDNYTFAIELSKKYLKQSYINN